MAWLNSLIEEGYLKTDRIIKAFKKIKREDFLPSDKKELAKLNQALPIGYGQTISQPLVVAFMIEKLAPKLGDKILDIGSGSGWTTALLSEIVGGGNQQDRTPSGSKNVSPKVIAIEIIPGLKKFGEKNVAKYNFIDKGITKFICADGTEGYKQQAPYDKILASAAAKRLPPAWKKQLKVEGRIVTPVGSSVWLFIKQSEQEFKKSEYPGFAFVPLVKEK